VVPRESEVGRYTIADPLGIVLGVLPSGPPVEDDEPP